MQHLTPSVWIPGKSAGKKTGMAATLTVLTVFGVSPLESQGLDSALAMTSECVESNQKAMANVATARLAEAEEELSAALSRVGNGTAYSCAGLILHNMATIASISGRFAEGERLATRSIATLQKVYPPDHLALLRPLLVLASTRLEQGNKSGARDAFNRLKGIRPERPHEHALMHAMTGSLLQSLGERHQAEVEYLAALAAWTEIGRGEIVDAGAVLTSLGTLYIEGRRFAEARQAVDHASAIFSQTNDAAPMDRSKLLSVSGALHARQREWPFAEKDFRDSLSLADGQPAVDPVYMLSLLTSFAEALGKNHHRQEGRRIEARAAALRRANTSNMVVDVTDLVAHPKPVNK